MFFVGVRMLTCWSLENILKVYRDEIFSKKGIKVAQESVCVSMSLMDQ